MIKNYNLEKLNSLTKYPSIPTYHEMSDNGILSDKSIDISSEKELYISEKLDGTNVRVVFDESLRFLIGSRNEFLYYNEDLIFNNSMNIVQNILPFVDFIKNRILKIEDSIFVLYGELFGGSNKNYTLNKNLYAFRLFDIKIITKVSLELEKSIEQISSEREKNKSNFLPMRAFCTFEPNHSVYNLRILNNIPTGIKETYEWLKSSIDTTSYNITDECNKKPEGLVVRNEDRSIIFKIRYEDYEKYNNQKDIKRS